MSNFNPEYVGRAGGILAYLTFVHFLVDWIFQSHTEAMKKTSDWRWRAVHCFIYAWGMTAGVAAMSPSRAVLIYGWAIFFLSHFIEDAYYPVYLWAKYIRRVPDVKDPTTFKEWVTGRNLGLILLIAVDQIIHIGFILPVIAMVLSEWNH